MFTDPAHTLPAFELHKDAWGRLHLVLADGTRFENVKPLRLFPFSERAGWVALRDGLGQEILLVKRLADLPAHLRDLLAEDLAQHEFVPAIERIIRISGDVEPCEWEVQTDRGRTRFVLKDENDVRRLEGERALVTDAVGVRYLIHDLRALDAASRRILEQYV
jgi:hypothetical protein